MKKNILLSTAACAVALFASGAVNAQSGASSYEALPEMRVRAPAISYYPGNQSVSPQDMGGAMSHDGGSFLKQIPGVSGGRIGGHGMEPIIRGQQQGQLNITLDGAFIHGGCPNRMDPPASFANVGSYDEVTVLHGYQTVQNGPGGTGGTVSFKRTPRDYKGDTLQWDGFLEGGLQSNGWVRNILGDVSAGVEQVEIRAVASASRGNDYKDGDGNTVRSAFQTKTVMLSPTWHAGEDTDVTFGFEAARTEDALFAGAGMDAPDDLSTMYRAKITHDMDGFFRNVQVEAYKTLANHLMDNFSLRANAGTKMKTKSDSDTLGGKITAEIAAGEYPLSIGLDHQNNMRDAKRYSGGAAAVDATNPQAYLWPDASIQQTGVFAEKTFGFSETGRIKLGGRYDYVRAKADAADQVFGARSANQMYQMHYGYEADTQTEHNVGALARLELDLNDSAVFFTGLSRSVRTADTTERFMAGWSGMAAMRWIGNPELDPEAHHQLDVGVMLDKPAWHMNANAYYDDVTDFIMRDRARAQDGILVNANQTIYRNIDATLYGFEMDGHYDLTSRWKLSGDAVYTWGENDEDGDALAQIPPLSGKLALAYAPEKWSLGGRANFAVKQNRIDDSTSGRDVRKTPGYVTLDLYGSYNILPKTQLSFGVNNVLDKDYAGHLNRSSSFDPSEVQVNEPGRSFYLRASARF